MARKKTRLWLKMPKRKVKTQLPIFNPDSEPRMHKRIITPVKGLTPKRPRIYSPLPAKSPTFHTDISSPMQVVQDEHYNLVCRVFSKLEKEGIGTQFQSFLELVDTKRFPLGNISFRLFLETVQFVRNKRASDMRYSDVTKRFWKVGYRIFHGKFLYFMGGFKGDNVLTADINFAVPSIRTLEDFNVSSIEIPKVTEPGIIQPVLKYLEKMSATTREYMLCADGKKVTSGIDSKGGDVDMFSCEDGESLHDRKAEYEMQKKRINQIDVSLSDHDAALKVATLSRETSTELLPTLHEVMSILSIRLRDGKQLEFRQTFGLEKFKRIAGPDWRNSRYIYVISGLQASLFQLRGFVCDTLTTINSIAEIACHIQGTADSFRSEQKVDESFQRNMLTLKDNSTEESKTLEPRFLKQRSDVWHMLRRKARITGSTMNNAIGLRGLKEQKQHFAKFIDGEETGEVPSEIQMRLDHGTLHEKDATATIVGKVIPTFYPNCVFVEEGCYVIPGEHTDTLCVISPDGSIRGLTSSNCPEEEVVSAIEIKCPFPSKRQTAVHYQLPGYYVCQCLAEMKALGTNQLLYVSYSQDSTTFLKVRFSDELWELIWEHVVKLYDNPNPTKPTKSNPLVKELRHKISEFVQTNVEFLCEMPSSTMVDSGFRRTLFGSPFLYPWDKEGLDRTIDVSDILLLAKKASTLLETGYNLLRRKATEVMVWVLSNKDRNSKLEIPCSLPIAYGLKDYKLTVKAMRKATEEVLSQCELHNLDVLTLYADGQWIQLMTRDTEDNPLTVYQLQRDIHKRVQKKTKAELVKYIADIHYIQTESLLQSVIIERGNQNEVYVKLKTGKLFSISTCFEKEVWTEKKKKQISDESDSTENASQELQTSWLPVQVLEDFTNDKDNDEIFQTMREVSNEVMAQDVERVDTEESACNNIDLSLQYLEQNIQDTAHAAQVSLEVPIDGYQYTQTVEQSIDTQEADQVHLVNQDISNIVRVLQENSSTSKKWSGFNPDTVPLDFFSKNVIRELSHKELNVIYAAIADKVPNTLRYFKKSWKKNLKVEYITGVFGHALLLAKTKTQRRKRVSPLPLRKLVLKKISSKGYPKAALAAAYCQHTFPKEFSEWQSLSPFPSPMAVDGLEESIQYWYSRPELRPNGKYLCKGTDCSHNLTHLRVRTCTTGVCGISSTAWKQCAKSNSTRLSIPHVEDLVDKQSVPMARTNFSDEVEDWMRANGYSEAAELTNVIRNWYCASDEPGIAAKDRVRHLLAMREYLLRNIDFAKFPPKTRYFNGVPVVTFEGMLMDIDSKLQLYGLTNTFNIRSVGSLAAETTVGILQEMYPSSQVSIKARDVPQLISSVVEVMTCKSDPKRGFRMRTSRTSGVYPMHEATPLDSDNVSDGITTCIPSQILCPRDHYFDTEARQKSSARKINFGLISGPSAPSRGALPVRQHHRKDESKILPTKRLGIEML